MNRFSPSVEYDLLKNDSDYGDNRELIASLKMYGFGITSISETATGKLSVDVAWDNDITVNVVVESLNDIPNALAQCAKDMDIGELAEQLRSRNENPNLEKMLKCDVEAFRACLTAVAAQGASEFNSSIGIPIGTYEVTMLASMGYIEDRYGSEPLSAQGSARRAEILYEAVAEFFNDTKVSETYLKQVQERSFEEVCEQAEMLKANETLELKGYGDCGFDITIYKDEYYIAEGESYEEYTERLDKDGCDSRASKEEFESGRVSDWNLVTIGVKMNGQQIGSTDDIHVDNLRPFLADIMDGTAVINIEGRITDSMSHGMPIKVMAEKAMSRSSEADKKADKAKKNDDYQR